VSIRLQLLFVALTTLMLPWAGCRYARELERTLRVSQEHALTASADTIAHALSATPGRVFRDVNDTEPFDAAQGDFYVFSLHNQPLLDGYREDWNVAAEPDAMPVRDGDHPARLQAGVTDRYLFLYVEVDDPHMVAEPAVVHPEHDRFERVSLTVQRPDGSLQAYFFATAAPGPIEAQSIVHGEDGTDHAIEEPRIQGYWLTTSRGYHLEARVPLSMVGPRLWIRAGDAPATPIDAGSAPARGGRGFSLTPGLDGLLATFIRQGTRATVIDANGLKLGTAGSLEANFPFDDARAKGSWYRSFLAPDTTSWPAQSVAPDRMRGYSVDAALGGHTAAEWLRTLNGQDLLLSASAPLIIEGQTRGAVILEQAGDQLLEMRDSALTHLFNLTLLATGLAVLFAFGVASVISLRIGRLRAAADSAVGSDGKIRLTMPESSRTDEIGALSRGFERLLVRLNEHTQYLRTLGGKLSHELRTPLSIVRSSLDNLESEGVREDQRGYLARAREGTSRLLSILSALGAAARVEEAIGHAERSSFDLRALLQSAVQGYRDAFTGRRIELEAPEEPCFMRGAPDLIVQMLDKLIDNAVDFSPAGGLIAVRLGRSGSNYELIVANDGPPIPDEMLERLFESLFEHRQGGDDKPHFGLGLYIVRLIAEFHEGHARAANRPEGGGAMFTVTLPLI
jgi:two-component system, OmpR family, sensor histidine kinase ChvG